MIIDRYEVAPEYFAEKYSMPVGERHNAMPIANAEGEDTKKAKDDQDKKRTKDKQRSHARLFFD